MKHSKVVRGRARSVLPLLVGLVISVSCMLVPIGAAGPAGATPIPRFSESITPIPVAPGGIPATTAAITVGSDGNLWLGSSTTAMIIRLTPGGVATAFTTGITPGAYFSGLTKGPDGNVWFTELNTDKVGKITPSGVVTEYALGNDTATQPSGIVTGPDGQLWFAERFRAAVGHITTSGVYTETTGMYTSTFDVAVGSDHAIWSTSDALKKLVRTTTAGVSSTYPTQRMPAVVVGTPSGDILVIERAMGGSKGGIERFSTAGVSRSFTEFIPDGINPMKATIGPDGDVWFTANKYASAPSTQHECEVGHVDPVTGDTTFYDCGTGQDGFMGVTVAPDGNLWTGGIGVANRYRFNRAPAAPTEVVATATGDAQVTLRWTPPASDPSAPTTGFHVTTYKDGVAEPVHDFDVSTNTRVITGLTNGAEYTFRVTASNVVGTGDPSAPSPAVTPRHTSDQEAFVWAAYRDFIARPPTVPELDTWVPYLESGGSRSSLVAQLAASPEWVSAIVTRFYTDTLGRAPDKAGLKYWDDLITSKKLTVASVASRLYASSEYFTHFGGGTPRTWVSDLYTKILRRSPATDQGGVAYWVSMVASRGRVAVAYSFYQSQESRMDRVTALYEALLHRSPDHSGQQYWAGQITKSGDVALAKNLALSAEYYARASARFP